MATDIHGVFQYYDENIKQWHDVSSACLRNRSYKLFAVLAGVPNWYLDWVRISPIAEPRGLPSDFALENANPRILRWLPWSFSREYVHHKTTDDKRKIWMGDHSWK
jgi:hypothetical protein